MPDSLSLFSGKSVAGPQAESPCSHLIRYSACRYAQAQPQAPSENTTQWHEQLYMPEQFMMQGCGNTWP
jgi:hypothetical protein